VKAYFRIYSADPRSDRTAKWGPLTVLYEADETGVPLRQMNLYAAAPVVDRLDREGHPVIVNLLGERFAKMRTEPLDLSAVATNQITAEEFEFSWASGLLRERDFGEFKSEVLAAADEDIQGVYEPWWQANTWYPNRPVSERIAVAERALRELLAEALISLVSSVGGKESPILREQHDAVLRAYGTWVVTADTPRVSYVLTDRGLALVQGAMVFRLP
jgi:hypothetical protein